MADFGTLELSRETVRSLAVMGFEEPTPIQARAIPCLLQGRDVVAQALTGTGKTAAYGVPLVERIDVKRAVPQAIVLLPTRELAIQVTDQLARIGQQRRVGVVPIYGGQPIDRQLRALTRGVHGIVATPGRLMDHMRRGTVDLSQINMLVLDEAEGGEQPANEAAPGKPAKAKKGGFKLFKRLPGTGLEEGQQRWWCQACQKSFVTTETDPQVCPEGHRVDDPELTSSTD